MSTIPEPWESALIAAGLTDPRNADRASWSALGRKIGVHTSTLSAMANGTRATAAETIEKVAEALRVDVRTVSEWVGRARSERTPFKPHEDADLLDNDERDAINRMIALLAKSKKRGQHEDLANSPAQKITGPVDGGGNVIPFTPDGPDTDDPAQPVEWAAYQPEREDDDGEGEPSPGHEVTD